MSGIAGAAINYLDYDMINDFLSKSNQIQNHRGPNLKGAYVKEILQYTVGLAQQNTLVHPTPLIENNIPLVFDGEIYNYLIIKQELQQLGNKFNNETDSELVSVAIKSWGIHKALNKLNGSWAFAWLDSANNRLYLVRDRFGIKPLYYYIDENAMYFASEIKTIVGNVPRKFSLDYQVISEYLLQSLAETSTNTFFKDIRKVPAGMYAYIDLNNKKINLVEKHYYILSLTDKEELIDEEVIIAKIRELFFDAVKIRISDKQKMGILLSGGVDSSAIAAAIKEIRGQNCELNLLSAISSDKRFDESRFIDKMAGYLESDVHKIDLKINPGNAFKLLDRVCWYNDEPIGSFSNVAHFLLMQQARGLGISVILSGQGADEILCGYRKYLGFYLKQLIAEGSRRKALSVAWGFLMNQTVINQFSLAEGRRYLPRRFQPRIPDITGSALKGYNSIPVGLGQGMDLRERQILDITRFSTPTICHTEDRMSMAWARLIRLPFLDHRLVELLIGLPVDYKLHNGWTKYVFRKAMEPYMPDTITWRKDKQGFVNPQSEWLKYELRREVNNYFAPDSLIFYYNFYDRNKLIILYENYCKQKAGKGAIWFKEIFNPLAMEIWLRRNSSFITGP